MSLFGNQNLTPKLHSLDVTQSLNGICIPIVWGTNRVTALLLWFGDFQSKGAYQPGGSGLGKGGNNYEYYAAILAALAQGVVAGIGNVWGTNGALVLQSVSEPYTVPSGGGTYTVGNASKFNSDLGVTVTTPYSYTANDYGSPGPVTASGVTQVTLSKAAGEYTQVGPNYTFPSSMGGQSVTVSYTFSEYTLQETQDEIVPLTGPYEITVQFQPQFNTDKGVIFTDTGVALTAVGGTPTVSGTYNPNGGNYLFAPADAGRPVAIIYTWNQSNSNVDPAATLAFTLLEGELGQAPWSYLTSNHLSQALGYSGIAMIGAPNMDLGEGAQMPNYNYELQMAIQFGGGIVDADLALVIQDFLQNVIYGLGFAGVISPTLLQIARDYWAANSFFVSPVLNAARPGAEIIEEWCEAGNVGVYWSEGELKFIPYGDTTQVGNGYKFSPATAPVVDLNDDDFIAGANEDPVQIDRTPWQDAYNEVKVQFTNRLNNYNDGVVIEQDDWAVAQFGLRPEGQKDYGFICTQEAATFAANIRLKRLVNIRKQYTFKISGLRYCFLEPMDLVPLTDVALGLDQEPVRITRIEEDADRVYTVTAEEFPWGTATATLYPKQPNMPPPVSPALADPGNTNVVDIFEPPTRVATTLANSPFQIWMALNGGPNWGGCNVFFSLDGSSYNQIQNSSTGSWAQTGPTRAGVTTADLPPSSSPDTTNTLSVEVQGQLFSVTLAQAQALGTLSKVGDEYLAYQNATLTGVDGQNNKYNLDYLLRGAFSTPVVDHPTGTEFVRLDSQLFMYSFDPSLAGKTVYFKFPAFNLLGQQLQDISTIPAFPFTIGGNNTSTNMMVDSIEVGGSSATIRIYQRGQPVGTPGSATLANGAVIALPADSQPGEALNTTYYVNYDTQSSSYVFYTDQNAWLLDQIVNGYVNIGQTTTPSEFSFIPLMGGGTIAIGAGSGAYGSSISFPAGYDASRAVVFVSPQQAYDPSNQIKGILQATAPGGVLQSAYQYRSSGGPLNAASNWVAAAWTAGAAVTVTTVAGGYTQVKFTTAMGDDLCVVVGQNVTANLTTPAGFFGPSCLAYITGMASTNATGNGLQAVLECDLLGGLFWQQLYYDNAGNQWGGGSNFFGVYWNPGGGVAAQAVTNGQAVTIPLPGGHSIALIHTHSLADGSSFGLPPGYGAGSLVTAAAAVAPVSGAGSNVAHGMIHNECTGTTYAGQYKDGIGNVWSSIGSTFAIATI